jgi:hypothetical protein
MVTAPALVPPVMVPVATEEFDDVAENASSYAMGFDSPSAACCKERSCELIVW